MAEEWKFFTIEGEKTYNFAGYAYSWYQEYPGFLKATIYYDTNSLAEAFAEGMCFVGVCGGKVTGIVYGEIKTPVTIEGHLFCSKTAGIDFLSALVTYAKTQALTRYESVITSVVRKHRLLRSLMDKAGFTDTGIRTYTGVHKSRLIEAMFYVAKRK